MRSSASFCARDNAGRRRAWDEELSSPDTFSSGGWAEKETMSRAYTDLADRVTTLKSMPTPEEVEDALTNVIDPELGLDFVELGLIYGVEVDNGEVHVTFTLTSPGCPIGPQVSEQIDEFVSELDGVQSVESTMTFTPPWTPERMSEDAKFALGF